MRGIDLLVASLVPPTSRENAAPAFSLLDQFQLQFASYAVTGSGLAGGAYHFEAPTALTELRDNAPPGYHIVMDVARFAGLTFSVGAVWWAVRVGGLMTSLFATAPAWRQFDPLPILRNKSAKDDAGKWLEEDVVPASRIDDRANREVPETYLEAGLR